MKYSGKTDIGLKRKNNQDSYTVISRENFLSAVVCDGMGGAKGGNVASTFASKAYSRIIKTAFGKIAPGTNISDDEVIQIMTTAVDKANEVVFETASSDVELEGMGTTLVSVLVFSGKAYVANVGDSRLYTMKDGTLKQITNDHSFVQFLLDKGSINAEEARNHPNRNIILRALGVNENVSPEIFILKDEDYDLLLLCSDGLTTHLSDDEIAEILTDSNKRKVSLKKKAELLIGKANENGGADNITAVLISKEESKKALYDVSTRK